MTSTILTNIRKNVIIIIIMPNLFEEYPELVFPQEIKDELDVLRAQMGLSINQVITITQGIGIAALQMLIEAGVDEGVEPVLDIAIRQGGADSPVNVLHHMVLDREVHNLSGLIEVAKGDS
jgi:hypothetical protein